MYEFTVLNNQTNEERIIFGYTEKRAYDEYKLNPNEWTTVYYIYID